MFEHSRYFRTVRLLSSFWLRYSDKVCNIVSAKSPKILNRTSPTLALNAMHSVGRVYLRRRVIPIAAAWKITSYNEWVSRWFHRSWSSLSSPVIPLSKFSLFAKGSKLYVGTMWIILGFKTVLLIVFHILASFWFPSSW